VPGSTVDDMPHSRPNNQVLRVLAATALAPLVVMKLDSSHSGEGIHKCSGC